MVSLATPVATSAGPASVRSFSQSLSRPSLCIHKCSSPNLAVSVFGVIPTKVRRDLGQRSTLSRASGAARAAVVWVLEPVGDGDTSHLGEAVTKPGPIRLEGDAFVLGRTGSNSDIVLGVPTVSGSHARIERKGESLIVTDLNSTNGTFLNEERLRPRSPTPVPTGSILTFGDQHLAMFKVTELIEALDV